MEIDKLALIAIKDHKALMTRSKGKALFYLPGGKRETGETDIQALKREVYEELDVDLLEKTIEFYGIFKAQADGKESGTIVKMTCYKAEYTGNPKPTSEIEEIAWMNLNNINEIAEVDKLIFNSLFN